MQIYAYLVCFEEAEIRGPRHSVVRSTTLAALQFSSLTTAAGPTSITSTASIHIPRDVPVSFESDDKSVMWFVWAEYLTTAARRSGVRETQTALSARQVLVKRERAR